MHLKQNRAQADDSAAADPAPRMNRDSLRRLTQAPLGRGRLRPGRAYLRSVGVAVADGRGPVAASRRSARLGDEDSYFALAMACADVDPRPLGDRSRTALNRLPTLAAGASGVLPPPHRSRRATPLLIDASAKSDPVGPPVTGHLSPRAPTAQRSGADGLIGA